MRLLLTAFEPYDQWEKNASWEALIALVSERGASQQIITRRYPVDLPKLQSRIESDLSQGVDAVLHLGQSPGISHIQLEAIALNIAGVGAKQNGQFPPIVEGGPVAYRTDFPIGEWDEELRSLHIPAKISYHAGTYLCNAAMYLSHHWFARRHERPLVGFIHLPLIPDQIQSNCFGGACMPVEQTSQAIGRIIDRIMAMPNDSPIPLA